MIDNRQEIEMHDMWQLEGAISCDGIMKCRRRCQSNVGKRHARDEYFEAPLSAGAVMARLPATGQAARLVNTANTALVCYRRQLNTKMTASIPVSKKATTMGLIIRHEWQDDMIGGLHIVRCEAK